MKIMSLATDLTFTIQTINTPSETKELEQAKLLEKHVMYSEDEGLVP
jgi:hypothetical protein